MKTQKLSIIVVHPMRIAQCAVLVSVMFLSACSSSPSLEPVSGKVLVAGKPAVGAMVMFIPEAPDPKVFPATAIADADGNFTLASNDQKGVGVGKYIVTVTWPDPNKKITDAQRMMGVSIYDFPDQLGGRYGTREKSSLRAEVKAGPNVLAPFELK
jgi:hypothetical protein